MDAVRLVYRHPLNVLLALAVFALMAFVDLWSSQVLILSRHGLSLLIDYRFVAAALIMAALLGVLVPLQLHAIRLAAASAAATGGTALGAILGTASMTCCAPVLLPSLLTLLGFSGATILSFNLTLARYWLPLATVSTILLLYALMSVIGTLQIECRLGPPTAGGKTAHRARIS